MGNLSWQGQTQQTKDAGQAHPSYCCLRRSRGATCGRGRAEAAASLWSSHLQLPPLRMCWNSPSFCVLGLFSFVPSGSLRVHVCYFIWNFAFSVNYPLVVLFTFGANSFRVLLSPPTTPNSNLKKKRETKSRNSWKQDYLKDKMTDTEYSLCKGFLLASFKAWTWSATQWDFTSLSHKHLWNGAGDGEQFLWGFFVCFF